MSSLIDEAFRASQEALTSVFGGDIELIPMTGGDYGSGPDPTRRALRIAASLMTQTEPVGLKGQQTGSGSEFQGSSRAMTDDPQLWVDGAVAEGLAWVPKRGDIVRALGRPGVPEFTVLAALKGDRGDLLLILTRGAAKRVPG